MPKQSRGCWKEVKRNKDIIKWQGLGSGRFNEAWIVKIKRGFAVSRANPMNVVVNYFRTRKKAEHFAKKWLNKIRC